MKWLDKLKYYVFNYRISKRIDNNITLFIGDLSNKSYITSLYSIINKYIQVNYHNNLEIALSLIQLLSVKHIDAFIKELNSLNKLYKKIKYKIYYKRVKYYNAFEIKIGLKSTEILDIISTDEYFLFKIIEFFKSYWNETEDITYEHISNGLYCAGSCCDIDTFKATNEFLKSIGIDIDKLL